jgi:hypothetical protein
VKPDLLLELERGHEPEQRLGGTGLRDVPDDRQFDGHDDELPSSARRAAAAS